MSAARWSLAVVLLLMPSAVLARVHRLAVVAGANAGLTEDVPLVWAENDARRVAEVLRELGAFDEVQLVLGMDASAMVAHLARAAEATAAIRQRGDQVLLLVYYSGHADERGLHLNGTVLSSSELMSQLSTAQAEVRLLVLDACHSGELTRTKGVQPGPLRQLQLQEALEAEGQAVLASSAGAESSQESDLLQGSFFTSHLLAGLRGAADANGDGIVGLREAHAYAYDLTVKGTLLTASGTQHPTYSVELSGRRDVPLTWPGKSDAWLGFRARSTGQMLVLRAGSEAVVAELPVQAGTTRRLALKAGAYVVKMRRTEGLAVGQVQLRAGADAVLDESEMQRVPYVTLANKGERSPGWLSLTVGLERGLVGPGVGYGLELGYVLDFDWLALWPSVSAVAGRDELDGALDVTAATVKPSLAAVRLFRFSRFNLFGGASVAAPLTLQWIERQPMRASLGFEAAGVAGGSVWLADKLGLVFKVTAGGRWLRLEAANDSGWRLALGAQLGLRLRI